MQPIRVAVAGPIKVHLEGLAIALTVASDFDVVRPGDTEYEDGDADLVVIDAGTSDDYWRKAVEPFDGRTPLVALGILPAHRPYWRRAGFAACLGPEDSVAQLVATVRRTLGALRASSRGCAGVGKEPVALTARELEVLALVSEGLTNSDIARRLHIEVATVKNHVHNLLGKLGVRRRGEAARWLRSGAAVPLPVHDSHARPVAL